MARHELYVGGPARAGGSGTFNRSQFPSAPFVHTEDAFQKIMVAAHKAPAVFDLNRVLDFGVVGSMAPSNSYGLADYVSKNAIVEDDTLGIIVVPKNHLLLGIGWKVDNPLANASCTVTPIIRTWAGAPALPAFATIDISEVGSGFCEVGGANIEGGEVVMTGFFADQPYIIDLELTELGTDPVLSQLRLELSAIVLKLHAGEM